MTAGLPEDLAPNLRAAAEALIAATGARVTTEPFRTTPPSWAGGPGLHRCYGCKKKGGKMGGHHVSATEVVYIHPTCHRKLHARGTPLWCTA